MPTATDELVEVRTFGEVVRIDTQGERALSVTGAHALASRLLDAATIAGGPCPLRPYQDRIVVEIIEEAGRVSGGGVHIPDTAQQPAFRGVVLAIGPGRYDKTLGFVPVTGLEKGDIVTMSRHAGYEIKVGDRALLTIRASDVLAILERGDGG